MTNRFKGPAKAVRRQHRDRDRDRDIYINIYRSRYICRACTLGLRSAAMISGGKKYDKRKKWKYIDQKENRFYYFFLFFFSGIMAVKFMFYDIWFQKQMCKNPPTQRPGYILMIRAIYRLRSSRSNFGKMVKVCAWGQVYVSAAAHLKIFICPPTDAEIQIQMRPDTGRATVRHPAGPGRCPSGPLVATFSSVYLARFRPFVWLGEASPRNIQSICRDI